MAKTQKPRWTLRSKTEKQPLARRNDLHNHGSTFSEQFILPMARQWARRAISSMGKRRQADVGIDLLCKCGHWLWDVGSRAEAVEAFEEVVRISPSNVRAHNNLGVAYWNLGDRACAVRHFRIARDLDPSDKDAVWNCGQIMAEVGELISARFLFESFLRDFGPDQEIATALVDLSFIASQKTSVARATAR